MVSKNKIKFVQKKILKKLKRKTCFSKKCNEIIIIVDKNEEKNHHCQEQTNKNLPKTPFFFEKKLHFLVITKIIKKFV
jgi:hypothetical protein